MLKDMGVTVVHPHQLPQTKFMDRKTWGGRASVKEQLLQMNAFAEGTQYLARLAGRDVKEFTDKVRFVPSSNKRGAANMFRSITADPHITIATKRGSAVVEDFRAWELREGKKFTAWDLVESNQVNNTRHEWGHLLTTPGVSSAFRELERKFPDTIGNTDWWKQNVSEYPGTNWKESLAEMFTTVTNPRYTKGSLPSELEALAERMLKEG